MRRRAVAVVASGLALALTAIGAATLLRPSSAILTGRALREPFVVRVMCEGTLRATTATAIEVPKEVDFAAKIGWIAADGSPVKAGDVVVRFDATEFEIALEKGHGEHSTSEHRIARAQTEATAARRGLDLDAAMAAREVDNAHTFAARDAEIYSRFEIIESEIDGTLAGARQKHAEAVRTTKEKVAKSDLALLEIERRKADLDIDHAQRGLRGLQVQAPHDGILVLERDWRGDVPRVGDTVWRGYKLAEIPRLEYMEAEMFVLEADAGGLAVGQKAEVVLDSRPGVIYPGRVRQVDTLARPRLRGSPLQFFSAVVQISSPDPAAMKPGQRVRATLTLAEKETAIVVPREAVFTRDGGAFVYRKKAWGGFEPCQVKLGATALGRVVVERGLSEGDSVALTDPTRRPFVPAPVQRPVAPQPRGGS